MTGHYGFYKGVVIDNADPEKRGRIKVEVHHLATDALPSWALPMSWGGAKYGVFVPPEVGDVVWVTFEAGQLESPLYQGGFFAEGETPDSFAKSPPTSRGFATPAGHEVVLKDEPGAETILVKHKSGTHFEMDADGGFRVMLKTGVYIDLSAKDDQVHLNFHGKRSILVTPTSMSLTTSNGMGVGAAIILKDDKVLVSSPGPLVVSAMKVELNAAATTLCAGGVLSAVMGEAMVAAFNAHTHVTTIPGTPTSPPVPPMIPMAVLSQRVKLG